MKKIAKCLFLLLFLFILTIFGLIIYIVITIQSVSNPDIIDLKNLNLYNSQYEIFDSENQQISTNSKNGQKTIKLSQLPEFVPQAFISIEDKTFYKHNGLNWGRIARAGITNIFSGYAKEGASTITQQLVKNIYLNSEKTITRKIQEAYLSLKLEQNYTKEEILETYLNVIYFGNGAFGIENASQTYFKKSAKDLTLSEASTLAGVIKSPKVYSPIKNPDKCKIRRNLVLQNMFDDGFISEKEYLDSKNSDLTINTNIATSDDYIQEILREASEFLNISERQVSCAGYRIFTNINSALQEKILALRSTTKENAVLIIDNTTGNLIATFGDISLKRQPASTIKPFLCYAPNFELGTLSPATPILDEPSNFNGYTPKNANGSYSGWVDTRTALSRSLNIPAVKSLSYTDLNYAVNFAKKCGFSLNSKDLNLASALGATSSGTPIKSVAQAYSSLASLGKIKPINLINRITDNNGKVLYNATKNSERIMSEETAFMLVDILKNSVTDGTAKKLNSLKMANLSAKTGTFGASDGTNTDAWCVSFTPNYTVLSWYGNSSGKSINNLSKTENGGTISARQSKAIWQHLKDFGADATDFVRPKNVSIVTFDTLSYEQQRLEIANDNTPERYKKTDIFNTKFAPKKVSNNFNLITIPALSLSNIDNNLTLSWEGEDIYNYSIFAKSQDKTQCIAMLSGKNESMNYLLPTPASTTDYFLLVESKFNKNLNKPTETKQFFVPTKN